MKTLIILLLICCYQLSAEKVIDCEILAIGVHCKITEPIKFDESDDVKFNLIPPKHAGVSFDEEPESGPDTSRTVVNNSYIGEITIESNAEDQTIPASLFATFPNIRHIFAGEQNIRGIKPKTFVKNTKKVVILVLDSHWIQKLEANSFEGLKNLENLSMKRGSLVEIDVSAFNGLDSLKILSVAENRIKAIAPGTFQNLLELKVLNLGDNFISNFDAGIFSGLVNVENFYLENNFLEALPENLFKNNKYATLIHLYSNNLKKIPTKLFSHISELESLDLQQNECIDLNYENAMNLFDKIEGDLSASCNFDPTVNKKPISAENPESKSVEIKCELEKAVNKTCSVYFVTIKLNDKVNIKLTKAEYSPEGAENFNPEIIEEVMFYGTDVQTIPASIFTTFENVKQLSMVGEKIRKIKPKTFVNAQNLLELNLKYHRIKRLETNTFEGLGRLITLILSHGSLSQIDVGTFNGLDSLKSLYLSGNKIKFISPQVIQSVPNLSGAFLNHNLIDRLEENTFSHLNKIEKLVISDNDLPTLPATLFGNNKLLSFINLSRNKLVNIPAGTFSHLDLKDLKLSSNVCIDKVYSKKESGSKIPDAIKNDLKACNT
jgi:Leucine-rich repeat (LRR) protein